MEATEQDVRKMLSVKRIDAIYLRDDNRHPIGMVGYIRATEELILYTVTYCMPRQKKLVLLQPAALRIFQEQEVGDQFSRKRGWNLLRRRFQNGDRIRQVTAPKGQLIASHILTDIMKNHRIEAVRTGAMNVLARLADRAE